MKRTCASLMALLGTSNSQADLLCKSFMENSAYAPAESWINLIEDFGEAMSIPHLVWDVCGPLKAAAVEWYNSLLPYPVGVGLLDPGRFHLSDNSQLLLAVNKGSFGFKDMKSVHHASAKYDEVLGSGAGAAWICALNELNWWYGNGLDKLEPAQRRPAFRQRLEWFASGTREAQIIGAAWFGSFSKFPIKLITRLLDAGYLASLPGRDAA